MAHKITIWNPKTELKELEDKVAGLEEDQEVCQAKLLVPTAAIKEAGWDEALVQEAIERGRARARGEEVGEASWEDLEREGGGLTDDQVSEASEIPGLEAPEEEPSKPGRVFNLLGDMAGEEPGKEEEVREEGPEDPELAKLLTYNFWDCPNCTSVNAKTEEFCPTCGFLRAHHDEALKKYHELKGKKMETAPMKEDLKEKFAAHLSDSRKRVVVGDETGWLCETCNSVWTLEQQKCPNRCKPAEPPTVESRAWGDEPTVIKAPKDKVPTLAEYAMAKQQMEDTLKKAEVAKTDEGQKYDSEILRQRIKDALDVTHFPGDPIPCTICEVKDNAFCKCCYECNEMECICCDECITHPCVCDETEICPICEARFPVAEPCPSGCDADHIELLRLYEEVKNDTSLSFVDKAKYMALLKEKMRLTEDVEEDDDSQEE